ncbi:MAG: cytochrome c3 family protein, partial [Desulfovibrionaceae bacterium]
MSKSSASADDDKARPGLIEIEVIAKQKALEMPAAMFLHDAHTAALKERGKDCSACHKQVKDDAGAEVMSLAFMRTEELDAEALKELYHAGCISCHAKDKAEGAAKFGPQAGECRDCHAKEPAYTAGRLPAGMDNALHYRHWGSEEIPDDKGQDTNCGSCHHQLDEATKKL